MKLTYDDSGFVTMGGSNVTEAEPKYDLAEDTPLYDKKSYFSKSPHFINDTEKVKVFIESPPHETKEEAIVREIKEELEMDIKVNSYFDEKLYEYPDKTINLITLNCSMESESYTILEHERVKWISENEFSDYEFTPADIYFVKKICLKDKKIEVFNLKKIGMYMTSVLIIIILICIVIFLYVNKMNKKEDNKLTRISQGSIIALENTENETYYSSLNNKDYSAYFMNVINDNRVSIYRMEDTSVYLVQYECKDLNDDSCIKETNEIIKRVIDKINKKNKFESISVVDKAVKIIEIKK